MKYRKIEVCFWQDTDMLELTPEGKYFYLYLLTNPHTNLAGIYEASKKVMAFETGFNVDTVDKLIRTFEGKGKIAYDPETSEILVINWLKYNWTSSPKVIKCIIQDLERVKSKKLLSIFWNKTSEDIKRVLIEYGYSIDTLSIPYPYLDLYLDQDLTQNQYQNIEYGYSMDTVSIPYHSKDQDQAQTQTQIETLQFSQFSQFEKSILKRANEIKENLSKGFNTEVFEFLEEPALDVLEAVNTLLEELGQQPVEKLTNGELLELAEAIKINRTNPTYFVKILNTNQGLTFKKCVRGSS
ncbi:hypothetical protein [Thermotoga sp. SG1]|uniref:hypothetical protein n=1 Tax=Thermotoga sp. SG1 TaxID=126739 RepID=UPI000C77C8ED|nr:hypothetical protein [Thermotoga sp. SG1]PLV55744.1 hypothetical protein AS006_08920 [Thermotoga sp. SG1]